MKTVPDTGDRQDRLDKYLKREEKSLALIFLFSSHVFLLAPLLNFWGINMG